MNNGVFGENFPYTNFHDINLDWIIKYMKETGATIEQALEIFGTDMEEVRRLVEQIREYSETAEESATSASESAESASESAMRAETAGIKKRLIVLGDSYGQGWTPDGSVEGWPSRLKTMMGIADADFSAISEGGAGFWVGDNTDIRYLPNMLQRAYDAITDPSTVSDIVLGLGYNDINGNSAGHRTNAVALTNKIRELFPQNPRVWLLGIGYSTDPATEYKFMSVYRGYATFVDYGFQKLTSYLCKKEYFASDGIHMNATGQDRIAQVISQILNNGSVEAGEFQLYTYQTVAKYKNLSGADMNGPIYTYRQDNRLIITCPTNNVLRTTFAEGSRPALGRTPLKIGTYENTQLCGFHNWSSVGQMTPCSIIYRAEGLAGYHHVDGTINIAPESDNDPTLYIWLSIFDVTSDFTNFLTINNVIEVQIAGFTMEFNHIG